MTELHNKLSASSPLYREWHQNPYASVLHFLLLIVFTTFMANTMIAEISTLPSDSLTATSINSDNRPANRGGVVGAATDRILVKFKASTDQAKRDAILLKKKLKKKSEIAQIGVQILSVDPGDTPDEVVQGLLKDNKSDIEFAEVDALVEPALIPNDPDFSGEWNKTIVNLPTAWDTTTGSTSVVVGVSDTGVDCTHEDLAANCVPGWNFYDNNSNTADVQGHGTSVAGVIAAVGNNSIGMSGSAWNVKIMPLRVSDPTGLAYMSTIASSVTYAADHGVKVVNNSFSGPSSTLDAAAQYLSSKTGGVLVRAEGNSGADSGALADPNIIMVSGTDQNDNLYSWSTYGADVDVSAPGCSNYATANGGGYRSFCGTSNASPEVAGLVALMYSVNPSLNAQSVMSDLFSSASDLGALGWDPYYGWGRIDAAKAIQAAASTTPPPPSPADTTAPSVPQNVSASASSSTQINISWSASTDDVAVAGYNIYRNGVLLSTTKNTSYLDSAVAPSTTYTYTVSSYDAVPNTSAQSSPVTATTPAAPFGITSFNVSSKTASSATITWVTNQTSTGSVAYGVSTILGKSVSASASSTTHSVTLSGLTKNTKYYYQISATGTTGSTLSAISSFKTGTH